MSSRPLPDGEELRRLVDRAVAASFPERPHPERLWESMLYTAGSGGKRLRGSLVLMACAAAGGDWEKALPAAVAVELIHAYSLIHDDLPIMDDDDYRRGRPTNHRVYGPAIALLAGDALQARAFAVLTAVENGAPPQVQLAWVRELAEAAGAAGLVGGQVVDWESEAGRWEQEERGKVAGRLEFIHRHKTGSLLRAAARLGGVAAEAGEETLTRLGVYGSELGLAFQITDDLLDEVGDPAGTGKAVGRDRRRGKLTYVTLFGVEESREAARRAIERAKAAIEPLGEGARRLLELADQVVGRSR